MECLRTAVRLRPPPPSSRPERPAQAGLSTSGHRTGAATATARIHQPPGRSRVASRNSAGPPRRPRFFSCGPASRSGTQRDDPDLDPAVERAALFGAVVGHRVLVAEAGDLETLAAQALSDEVGGNVLRPLLGDALVHGGAADVVGVAADLDDGLVVFAQGRGDVVERRVELRLEFGTVEVEGHAVGQVQLDGVALAVNRDAGAGGLATQFGLLPVLV